MASAGMSDSAVTGRRLDPGARRVMEDSFAVDLGGVRVHAGAQVDAFLRDRGLAAAAMGHRVLMPGRAGRDGDAWLRILAHEVAHTIQQAQGAGRVSSRSELAADSAALALMRGRTFPDVGLAAPAAGRGAAALAGFNSWEHRLMGDLTGDQLAQIVTRAEGWQVVVQEQLNLLSLFITGDSEITKSLMEIAAPGTLVVNLHDGCLATFGEINAVADFVGSAADFWSVKREYMFPFLQQIRQETYQRLGNLLHTFWQPVHFAGAITRFSNADFVSKIAEAKAIEKFTGSLGTSHYQGLLARNACHFAPFAWARWIDFHARALDLANRAYRNKPIKDFMTDEAWAAEAYAAHFLQDSFAPGHLTNKTLVMQQFLEWVQDSAVIPVLGWNDVRGMTVANQPGLMGSSKMYTGPSADSNDPQVAEEQKSRGERILATSIRAYGDITQEQAYYQYLAFLKSTAIQLASNQVHDYFNKNGLDVASADHPGLFRIYGDEKLLTSADQVRIAAGAVARSRAEITSMLDNGPADPPLPWTMATVLPSVVADSKGDKISLLDWHTGELADKVKDIFSVAIPIAVGWTVPSMGLVSQDEIASNPKKLWKSPLGTNAPVTTLWDGQRLFAGSGGTLYELDPATGKTRRSAVLGTPPFGVTEMRFASGGETLYAGMGSTVFALKAADLTRLSTWSNPDLEAGGLGAGIVNVLYSDDGHLYAGCQGWVYELDPLSGTYTDQTSNRLKGFGNHDVRLSATEDYLIVATGDVIIFLQRNAISGDYVWPPEHQDQASSAEVNILAVGSGLFSAMDDHYGVIDMTSGAGKIYSDSSILDFKGNVTLASDGVFLYQGRSGRIGIQELSHFESGDAGDAEIVLSKTGVPTDTPVSVYTDGTNLFGQTSSSVFQVDTTTWNASLIYEDEHVQAVPSAWTLTSDGMRLYCGASDYVVAIALRP